jgi:hypothetical protein
MAPAMNTYEVEFGWSASRQKVREAARKFGESTSPDYDSGVDPMPMPATARTPQQLVDLFRADMHADHEAILAGHGLVTHAADYTDAPRVRPEGVDPAITIAALRRVNREQVDEIDRLRARLGDALGPSPC